VESGWSFVEPLLVVIVLIGIAEIKSVEDGTECGIGARVERRCGKEISNFRFEISEGSEEGLIRSAGPRLIAVVVDVGGRRRARRLHRNRTAIDQRPYGRKYVARMMFRARCDRPSLAIIKRATRGKRTAAW